MIRRLLYISGLAILAVIMFHAAGLGFVAMFAWRDQYTTVAAATAVGSPSYFYLRLVEQVTVFALPAFMFISGYFVAFATGRARRTLGWDAVGSRIKTLIIPYTIWTLVLFAWGFVQGQRHSLAGYAVMYLTGRTSPAYYYVPLLIQLYLLSPFLVPLAREHPAPTLVVTGLIQLAVQLSYLPALLGTQDPALIAIGTAVPKWLFVTRIFWFTAGIVAGFHLSKVREWLERMKWGLVLAALALIPLGMLEWEIYARAWWPEWLAHRETLLDSLFAVAVIGSLLAFSQAKLPLSRPMEDLGSRSYGIYLTHLPIQETFARVIYHVAPVILGYQIVLQPLLIAVGLGGSLTLMWLVSHSPASRYYRYLFG